MLDKKDSRLELEMRALGMDANRLDAKNGQSTETNLRPSGMA